jgi:hypothetical protein
VAAFGYDPGYDTSFRLSSTTTGSTTDWSPTSSNDTYVYFRDTAPREPAETLAEMLRRTRGPGGHYWHSRLSGYTQDEYRKLRKEQKKREKKARKISRAALKKQRRKHASRMRAK